MVEVRLGGLRRLLGSRRKLKQVQPRNRGWVLFSPWDACTYPFPGSELPVVLFLPPPRFSLPMNLQMKSLFIPSLRFQQPKVVTAKGPTGGLGLP